MARVESAVREVAGELLGFVRGLDVGSLDVRRAALRLDEGAFGDDTLFIDVTLADPPAGSETWPVDDVLELHRLIADKAIALELPVPWHVTLRQETPEEPEPEDAYLED